MAILALHVAGESLEDGSLAADDQCDNEGQGGTVNAGSSLLHLLTIDKDTAVWIYVIIHLI